MTTLQTVHKIIAAELDVDPAELDPARPLQELGVDSLTIMECLFKIEDEFKISVDSTGLSVSTMQDIADLVDALVQAKASEVP